MPYLQKEPGSEPIVQFTVPYRGTNNSNAINTLSPDTLYSSLNVFIREGKLRNRPGLAMLNSYIFANPILGAALGVTPVEKRILAVDQGNLYELGEFDDTWTLRTSLTFANDNVSPIDIAYIETTSQYIGLIASETFALKQWTISGGASLITPSGGTTVPIAKSVCIAGRRVICLIPPHTIAWSKIYDYTNFPATAIVKVAQTNDAGVCVRSLSNLSFALYKERSIYTARAQAGDDSTAFAFSEPIIVEGPASLRAVVSVAGTHIYMTKNGRIGLFNGTQYPQWLADGVWLYLQTDIDPLYTDMIFGIYDYRLHTVVFMYPRNGDAGQVKGMVIINLPLEGVDVQQGIGAATFLGMTAKPCSAGCEMRFNKQIDRSLLFTATEGDNQSFILDENTNTDDGSPYQCSFQTGLAAVQDARHSWLTAETFLERRNGYGALLIEPVLSDALETKTGSIPYGSGQFLSLETNPVQEYTPFTKTARFCGLKYSWSSINTVRYAGAVVYSKGVS